MWCCIISLSMIWNLLFMISIWIRIVKQYWHSFVIMQLLLFIQGPKGQADHRDKTPPEKDVGMLRHEVDSLKRDVVLLSKKVECIDSSSGNENSVGYQKKAEQQRYASLYNSPANDRKQACREREVAASNNEHEFDENPSFRTVTKTIGSVRCKSLLIDGKIKKPANATGLGKNVIH